MAFRGAIVFFIFYREGVWQCRRWCLVTPLGISPPMGIIPDGSLMTESRIIIAVTNTTHNISSEVMPLDGCTTYCINFHSKCFRKQCESDDVLFSPFNRSQIHNQVNHQERHCHRHRHRCQDYHRSATWIVNFRPVVLMHQPSIVLLR